MLLQAPSGIFTEYGFPGGVLVILIIAIWRSAKFLAPRAEQVFRAHLDLVNDTRTVVTDLHELVPEMTLELRRLRGLLDENSRAVNRLADKIDKSNGVG